MFGEPPRTEYDAKFSVTGIPVRVHPFFWLLACLLGMNRMGGNRGLVIFVVVAFVSILLHELGHAWTIRHFGWQPRIVLHGFGGAAIHERHQRWGAKSRDGGMTQILISLAGPLAGFALALTVIIGLYLTNSNVHFPLPILGVVRLGVPDGKSMLEGLINQDATALLVYGLLEVNIYWGLLNLLPIYPLDGGKVCREVLLSATDDAIRKSLTVSMVTAGGMAALCLLRWGQPWMGLLFGYMAYSNYQQLTPQNPYGGGRSW